MYQETLLPDVFPTPVPSPFKVNFKGESFLFFDSSSTGGEELFHAPVQQLLLAFQDQFSLAHDVELTFPFLSLTFISHSIPSMHVSLSQLFTISALSGCDFEANLMETSNNFFKQYQYLVDKFVDPIEPSDLVIDVGSDSDTQAEQLTGGQVDGQNFTEKRPSKPIIHQHVEEQHELSKEQPELSKEQHELSEDQQGFSEGLNPLSKQQQLLYAEHRQLPKETLLLAIQEVVGDKQSVKSAGDKLVGDVFLGESDEGMGENQEGNKWGNKKEGEEKARRQISEEQIPEEQISEEHMRGEQSMAGESVGGGEVMREAISEGMEEEMAEEDFVREEMSEEATPEETIQVQMPEETQMKLQEQTPEVQFSEQSSDEHIPRIPLVETLLGRDEAQREEATREKRVKEQLGKEEHNFERKLEELEMTDSQEKGEVGIVDVMSSKLTEQGWEEQGSEEQEWGRQEWEEKSQEEKHSKDWTDAEWNLEERLTDRLEQQKEKN
eukprot:TRINITY_DN10065_c0_g1_i5.p1 TRINITY_DN10065_c0_g1~~TRINITY_DN10065_c0_g1_i5.p1  ORF type:complete len:495 (-),score=142.23 TRINITY_DN10065_c0_g1_i5:760-2244(-)